VKIYIASRYGRRFEMLGVTSVLMRAGHVVTSRWVEGRGEGPEVEAKEDIDDVLRADCLLSFSEEPTEQVTWAARGGRHVEFGVALATGKRLCLIGPRENVFHYLPRVELFPSLDQFVAQVAPEPRKA
jgi:hypothetical protein